jgi:hypothetical protein
MLWISVKQKRLTNGAAAPRTRRQSGLFAAFAAPFRDLDERTIGYKSTTARNEAPVKLLSGARR